MFWRPFQVDGLLTRRFPPNDAPRAIRRSWVVIFGTLLSVRAGLNAILSQWGTWQRKANQSAHDTPSRLAIVYVKTWSVDRSKCGA